MANTSSRHHYALALGSNRALSARHSPARLLEAAIAMIGDLGDIEAVAPLIATRPIGPSSRMFMNGALVLDSALPPVALLKRLQDIERALGRKRHLRWGARSIDIDIILWSGGRIDGRTLKIPHPSFRERLFVLIPLLAVAAHWRDPHSGLAVRHLLARAEKRHPSCVQEVDQPHHPL